MKILYIAELWSFQSFGVVKKEISKVRNLNKVGLPTEVLFFHPKIQIPPTVEEDYIRFVPLAGLEKYAYLETFLAKNHAAFDFFIFRYPLASRQLLELVKKYPKKFCFEHNTKELDELEMTLKPQYTFRDFLYRIRHGLFDDFTWAILRYPFQYKKRIRDEKKYTPQIFQYAKLGFAVGQEIADYETQRCSQYKTFAVGNGIDVATVPLRILPVFDNRSINFVLLSGSRSTSHGCDRVLKGLQQYKGNLKITFYAVGEFFDEDKALVQAMPENITIIFQEVANGKDLDDLMNICHLGISSLATHRKNMKETNVLKTREYLARGLPIVLSHQDIDLYDKEDFAPFVLNVVDDDTPLVIEDLIDFVRKVYQIPQHHEKIRACAFKYLDMQTKALQIKNILENNA